VASTSRLIQPLISTHAVSALENTFQQGHTLDGVQEADCLPSRRDAFSRYIQVVATSTPLAAADILAIASAYILATLSSYVLFDVPHYSNLLINLLTLTVCHLVVGFFQELFPASGMNPVRELRTQVTSIAIAFSVLLLLNGLVGKVTTDELITIAVAFPIAVLVAPAARFSMRKMCAPRRWWGEQVIIVGSTQQGMHVHEFLRQHPQRGLKPLGIVDHHPSDYWRQNENDAIDFLGATSDLVRICRELRCHWVIAAIAGNKSSEEVSEILTKGSLIPNLVVLRTNLMMPTLWVNTFDAAGLGSILIRDRLLFPFQRIFKRIADIILSAALMACCLPLFAAIAIWVRRKSNGPVLYCHERIGRSGKSFGAWKFRTMVPDAPRVLEEYLASNPVARTEWDEFHKLKNDPRVIPRIGAFLRRTSLDELPQLWNVLKGDMSLVGPRPVYTMDEIKMYGDLYALYLRVRPGLTGLWQVSGRNNTTFADKVQMDTYYAMNWSLWLDYFILLRTVRTVLFREGSY